MGLPLINNDFISPPTPPSAISNTTAQLMAQAGALQVQRIEKATQTLQATALAPHMANLFAGGYKKVSEGDMSGFEDMMRGSMVGMGNPLLAGTAQEALRVGTTVAHEFISKQAHADAVKLQREHLDETILHDRNIEEISRGKGTGAGSVTGQQNLAFRRQEAYRKWQQLLQNRKVVNDKLKANGMAIDESPINVTEGVTLPYNYDDNQAKQYFQLDESADAPLPQRDAALPSQQSDLPPTESGGLPPVRQEALPVQQGEIGIDTTKTDAEVINPSKVANTVPLDGGKAPAAPAEDKRPTLALVNESKAGEPPRMVLTKVASSTTGGITVDEGPNPEYAQWRKENKETVEKLQDSATLLQTGNSGLHEFMVQNAVQNHPVEVRPIINGDKGYDKETPQVMFYARGEKTKDNPNGIIPLRDSQGNDVPLPKEYGDAFRQVQTIAGRMGKDWRILSPDLEKAKAELKAKPQAPTAPATTPEQDNKAKQVASGATDKIAASIGQDRLDAIRKSSKTPAEFVANVRAAEKEVDQVATEFGAKSSKELAADRDARNAEHEAALAKMNERQATKQNALNLKTATNKVSDIEGRLHAASAMPAGRQKDQTVRELAHQYILAKESLQNAREALGIKGDIASLK